MNHYLKKILIVLSMMLLSGCLSPVKVKPHSSYLLTATPDVAVKRTRPITILVTQPDANAAYNTMQMAYTVKPYEIAYFSQNQWAETPSQMLQPLIIQTLQDTHAFRAVVKPPFFGLYDYVLNTDILRLEQDFTRNPSMLRLVVRAQLSRGVTNKVIATKEFSVSMPMPQRSPYGGVMAANYATKILLQELALFCIAKTR